MTGHEDFIFNRNCFRTGLDYDCKKWRLFADVLNDVAMLTELLTPRQPLLLLHEYRAIANISLVHPKRFVPDLI
jgi:hypothetical protein